MEQFKPNQNSNNMDNINAINQIKAFEQQVMQGGSVDSEPDAFKSIINQLSGNEITPQEAILLARQIMDQRQDYH